MIRSRRDSPRLRGGRERGSAAFPLGVRRRHESSRFTVGDIKGGGFNVVRGGFNVVTVLLLVNGPVLGASGCQ